MAGTIVANTINTDTGLFSTQNAYQGIAKAWVNFSYTGTIAGSFNVSSITVGGTGTYTINFATAMPNSNYSVLGSCSGTSPASTASAPCIAVAPNSTTACSALTYQSQAVGNQTSLSYNFVAVFSS